jgi:colicin import membrane protein
VTEDAPIRIAEHEWERGLWWMVLASGALHALLIGLALLAPLSFMTRRPPLVSYTVDLIAPERLGGTNMVPGGKGNTTGAPLVAAQAAAAPAPAAPPPKVEAPKPPAPAEPPHAPEPKPPPPKAEPVQPPAPQVALKPEPKPPPPVPKAEEPKPPPKPKEPEPKPKAAEPKPNPNDLVVKNKAKKVEPQPSPPAAQPAASPKAVAKAEPAKAPSPKAAQSSSASSRKGMQAKAAEDKKSAAGDAKAPGGSELDTRIAAAVKRVEQQVGVRGGGLGTKAGAQPGGPLAVGPGEGAGGSVAGFEYLLYLNQLQARLKQNWAWAGTDRNRKAVVRFGILETGEIVDVRITEASGDPTYDASVERAVRAANPMPPPPEAYRKQFSDVEYTFTPESMDM